MTITVTIHFQDGETQRTESVVVSQSALDAMRIKPVFTDPADVETMKALAGAFYTKCDADPYLSNPGREFALARTKTEEAVDWAVKGATKGV